MKRYVALVALLLSSIMCSGFIIGYGKTIVYSSATMGTSAGSTGATAVQVPPIATTPAQLSGLTARFQAEDYVYNSGGTASWASRVGTYTLTQGTEANKPTASSTGLAFSAAGPSFLSGILPFSGPGTYVFKLRKDGGQYATVIGDVAEALTRLLWLIDGNVVNAKMHNNQYNTENVPDLGGSTHILTFVNPSSTVCSLYVDGSFVTFTGANGTGIAGTDYTNIYMGVRSPSNRAEHRFSGVVQYVKFYNRTLTASEIASLN